MALRDLLPDYQRFLERGERVGRAVVTRVFGSAPLREGATLLAAESGAMAGSVSGGCVEAATAEAVCAALRANAPRRERFGVADELAWDVGLPCGGTIEVFVEPGVRSELLEAARGDGGVVLATSLSEADRSAAGATLVISDAGDVEGPIFPPWLAEGSAAGTRLAELAPAVAGAAREALEREASETRAFGTSAGGELEVFLEVFPRQPTLVVFGAMHVAVELVPLARRLGYRTIVADGRSAFLTRERFPEADDLVLGWPEEAFHRIGLGPSTYVCVLTHDPKFDHPALMAALRSPARYVGAIGSRRTQNKRRQRLREAGLSEEEVATLRGPIGLDLGGRQPPETALAILAELTAVRYGGSARPMRERSEGAGG